MLEISRLSNDIRENAGLRSTLLTRYAATLKPFAIPERMRAVEAAGSVKITWRRMQRIAEQVETPRIAAAIEFVRTEFFEKAGPVYDAMMAAARDGTPPPMEFLAFRAWTVGALTAALAARDVPIAEVSEKLDQMRDEAILASTLGLFGIGGLFLLLVGAGLALERSVLRPIGALTGTLDAFSRGETAQREVGNADIELAESNAQRSDEIGSLARAVDRIRTHARELENLNQRFDAVIGNLPQGVSLYDEKDRLIVANRRYAELYGLNEATSLIGLSLDEIGALRAAKAGGPVVGAVEFLRERLSGADADLIANCVAELPNGRILALNGVKMPGGGWLSTHLDITERRRAEAQLAFMADHDALTGLANRSVLARELERALAAAANGAEIALICLDLDRFKTVNDTLGHALGDELLKQVAQRLRACVRHSDIVARLGGDEFAIMIEAAETNIAKLGDEIIETISRPYDLDGHSAEIGASVGIALGPRDGAAPPELLKAADMAMYRAKLDGRRTFRFFEPEMDAAMHLRRQLEFDMRGALARGEFELHYQPIVNLQRNEITSFEALLRWNHPSRGRISPADFIPLAEDSGMIVEIGNWVLRQACGEAMSWPRGIKVSVNLSPRQFKSGRLFANLVTALRDTGLPASRLELEITERVMLANSETTLAILHQLRTLGVSIAMDDFGTGYSSLSYLRRFPFDKIKIDQSFIRDVARDPGSISIVQAVIALAAGLRMTATAEGVETQAQHDMLLSEGCTEIQGYLISRPIPAAEIPTLLQTVLPTRNAA